MNHSTAPAGERTPAVELDSGMSKTLHHGLAILEVLSRHPHGLSTSDLADAVGVHRTVAHRLVRTLEAHRLCRRDDTKRVTLGTGLVTLAEPVEQDLRTVARPVMEDLAERTRATVHLVLRESASEVRALVVVEPRNAEVHVAFRPGQVHAIDRGSAGLAMLAALPPSHAQGAGVFAALVVGFALDSADGQLARLTGKGSAAGEWLDHVVDCAKMLALHMAVLVSFHRHFDLPDPRWLLVPVVFQFAAVLVFFGGVLTEQLKRRAERPAPAAPPSTLRSVALLPVDYGVFCAVFLFLGSRGAFTALYCALCAAHLLFLAAFSVKWYRELSAPAPREPAREPVRDPI